MTNPLPEITTVGQLKKILQYFSDETPIYFFGYRYTGGGDEEYDCSFIVSEHYKQLIITPTYDGVAYGEPLNPEEL